MHQCGFLRVRHRELSSSDYIVHHTRRGPQSAVLIGRSRASLDLVYQNFLAAITSEFGFVPKELILRADTGELTIKNETQQIVVDKNGKVLR